MCDDSLIRDDASNFVRDQMTRATTRDLDDFVMDEISVLPS
jgi:hypothetical protein